MPQTPALAYVRQGTTPFFRLPSIDVQSAAPYAGLDAVVIGVPFDQATTYRPGARFAPYELRRGSARARPPGRDPGDGGLSGGGSLGGGPRRRGPRSGLGRRRRSGGHRGGRPARGG